MGMISKAYHRDAIAPDLVMVNSIHLFGIDEGLPKL